MRKTKTMTVLNRRNDPGYIDKTKELVKGMEAFPSLYIEGAAAAGKSAAVRLFLENSGYPYRILQAESCSAGSIAEAGKLLLSDTALEDRGILVIDHLERLAPDQKNHRSLLTELSGLIQCAEERLGFIIMSRRKPPFELLDLIWKQKMKLITAEAFLFSETELRRFLRDSGLPGLNAEELYSLTGGWPGAAAAMISLADSSDCRVRKDWRSIKYSYEIQTYIDREIIGSLSEEEHTAFRRVRVCPWVTSELMCELWQTDRAEELLTELTRMGFLLHDKVRRRYRTAPLFLCESGQTDQNQLFYLGRWYEKEGCIKEALLCYGELETENALTGCLLNHYKELPYDWFADYVQSLNGKKFVINAPHSGPEAVYLQGLAAYIQGDFPSLEKSIAACRKYSLLTVQEKEIYLNLTYLDPSVSLQQWMEELDQYGPIYLFETVGRSHSALTGLRDLTGLFACSKKEENRYARIWHSKLNSDSRMLYLLARAEYYSETLREEALSDTDVQLLTSLQGGPELTLCAYYCCSGFETARLQSLIQTALPWMEQSLLHSHDTACILLTEAAAAVYCREDKEQHRLDEWLVKADIRRRSRGRLVLSENTYALVFREIIGLVRLRQYDQADSLLKLILPYLRKYRRNRLLAEMLFCSAIVERESARNGPALRLVMESFSLSEGTRCVKLYTGYGEEGTRLLREYEHWMTQNNPSAYRRKKKYNYGTVLRMPFPDYLGVLLRESERKARRASGSSVFLKKERTNREKLTLTELLILQDINSGLTNAQICRERGIKITTVKTHLNTIYRKLEVRNRAQAAAEARKRGLLESGLPQD